MGWQSVAGAIAWICGDLRSRAAVTLLNQLSVWIISSKIRSRALLFLYKVRSSFTLRRLL